MPCRTVRVLPLARFGAFPAYVTAAWCGLTAIVLAREGVGARNSLLVAAKAHCRSGTSHIHRIGVIKGKLRI